jgi:glycosyltransferase involved in cell wall biosynthesis
VEPLISVIIPCYNHAHFLGDAISSVNKSGQSGVEIIIVDDGSEDDAADVARSFSRTKYVRQENGGQAKARNHGLQESRGRFLVFLDADDMLAPGALDIGVSAMAAHARAAMVYGRCRRMAGDGTIQSTPAQQHIERDHYRELLKTNYIWMPAMAMFRREALERAGGFDPSVNAAADYGVYLRVARTHPLHDHGRVVAYYRRHDDNLSGDAGRMLQESLTVLRRERPFAEHDAGLLAAYYEGWKGWQNYYGAQLVNEIRSHARGRQWTRVLRKSARLAWLHPGGVREHALRKISTSLRGSRNARH